MASLARTFEHSSASRSSGRPLIQYFFSVRTASAWMPKSAMAAITLWATGSITPGLGSTWIQVAPQSAQFRAVAAIRLQQRHSPTGADHGPLDHAIGQQFVGDPLDLAAIEIALDQVAAGGGDGQIVGQIQVRRRRRPRRGRRGPAGPRPDRCQLPKASRFFFARVRKRVDFGLIVVADGRVQGGQLRSDTAPGPSARCRG